MDKNKKSICLTIAVFFFFCGSLLPQEQPEYVLRFPKEIPADKAAMIMDRINTFAGAIQSDNYAAIASLWYDSLNKIEFSGDFMMSLNHYKEEHEKEYPRDMVVEMIHCVDKEANEKKYKQDTPGGYNRMLFGLTDNKKITAYVEFGFVVQGILSASFSEKNGMAEDFSYLNGSALEDETVVAIEWEDGSAVIVGDLATLSKMPVLPHPNKKKREKDNVVQWGKIPRFPRAEEKNVQHVFEQIKLIASIRKFDDCTSLLDTLRESAEHHAMLTISFCQWRCLWIYAVKEEPSKSKKEKTCYAYVINRNGSPDAYLEGDVTLPDYFEDKPVLSKTGRGIEVRFHSNGYPKSYRTLVRNRLFGRQIEWDDKGNVVSDVDLDIPKEIKEPKKKDSETNPVIDDVQEK